MKRINPLFVVVPILFIFAGCLKDTIQRNYTFYRPVYRTKDQVRQNIKSLPAVELIKPGKMFYKDGYVFLNELDKGVHIIDVKNPATPLKVAFVNIPGCIDLAVRGNILYADLYTDLVAIDISNPLDVKLTTAINGVFPHRYYDAFSADTSKVITDWIRVDTTVMNQDFGGWGLKSMDMIAFSTASGTSGGTISNGIGGSMARFALLNDRMYTVDYSRMKVFNTAVPAVPVYVKQTDNIGFNIETIFPFGNNLFIGSMNGMYIYDVSNKDNPTQKGSFTHARVCDPVISDGNYAYVTLRNGTKCGGYINQLDVVDIGNISKPSLLKSYMLTNPHGLSKDGTTLLICDGADGLKLFDAANAGGIKQVAQVTGFEAYDVIAVNGLAIVSAVDGLYLISYSQATSPKIVGTVKLKKS
jgi:hypothetical protein